jgi:hypothetical protein
VDVGVSEAWTNRPSSLVDRRSHSKEQVRAMVEQARNGV